MEKGNTVSRELVENLKSIAANGIQADSKRLKEDMCTQFADFREWIREYAVNAHDAGATYCEISGREDETSSSGGLSTRRAWQCAANWSVS